MLIQEDTEEIVGEIMDELLSKVMEGCLKVDIERQLIPFCASWAKNYLTQIVERQFLCLDEGEGPDEASKTKDSEPMPGTPDAWAEGCVPVINATLGHHLTSQKEADNGQVPLQTEPRVNHQCHVMPQMECSSRQTKKETSPQRLVTDIRKHYKVVDPCTPPKTDQKKRQQVNSPPKHFQRKLLPPLSCSTEKWDVEVQGKNMRRSVRSPHQQKSWQHIPKLDKLSLPRHCLFPQYEIVDNNDTKSNLMKSIERSRLEPRFNKQQTERTLPSLKPLTSSKDQPKMFQGQSEDNVLLKKLSPSRHRKEQMKLSGPLRLDTMVLAKGVSLLDPQSVELNPLKCNNPTHSINF
ncbi:uncharacterized protein C2orf81 homolog isoform X2 [Amphiprion ocellaris]|uniref:uncharacterized protein C2orf81 homolog isoform X2 n=1 Tax=Amphiprion ocellaris TaxID=80972 RepID=UPI0024114B9A|nr:uncharacterized protein C2orf81 homolog isoform X2 [Amphiprion ocellaris]